MRMYVLFGTEPTAVPLIAGDVGVLTVSRPMNVGVVSQTRRGFPE
jgi:hypothetical protein